MISDKDPKRALRWINALIASMPRGYAQGLLGSRGAVRSWFDDEKKLKAYHKRRRAAKRRRQVQRRTRLASGQNPRTGAQA